MVIRGVERVLEGVLECVRGMLRVVVLEGALIQCWGVCLMQCGRVY